MKNSHRLSTVVGVGIFLLVPVPLSYTAPGDFDLMAIGTDGQVDWESSSWTASISINGRYVAFVADASNLVPNDTNNARDVFVRDRLLKKTVRVSVNSAGAQTQGGGGGHHGTAPYGTTISRDGRFVAFPSAGADLITNDTNGLQDIFVHDNQTGQTIRASVSTTGAQANGKSDGAAFSADGRYIVFESEATNLVLNDTNGVSDIFIKDLQTGVVRIVSANSQGQIGNGLSYGAAITGDARYVAFTSAATNLEIGDTNALEDVFVRDLTNGSITRIAKSSPGVQEFGSSDASISDNGRYITFSSEGNVYILDRQTETTRRISYFPFFGTWGGAWGQIDPGGRMVIFHAGGFYLVCDQLAGTIEMSNLSWVTGEGYHPPSVSGDGTVIGFTIMGMSCYEAWVYEYGPAAQMKTFAFNRATVAGQNMFTATLELFAPAGPLGAIFELSSSSPALQVPATLTIAAGLASRTFQVRSLPVTATRVESVTVHWGTQSLIAPITLVPLKPSAFQFTPNSVIGGNPVSARLVMNGVAGPGGQLVTLTDNSQFASTPASVTVPPASTQVIFTIQTLPVTATKYVTVTASVPQGFKTGNFVIRTAPPQ